MTSRQSSALPRAGAGAARAGATPRARLIWYACVAAAAVVIVVVAAPVEAVFYAVPVPWALLLTAVQGAALVAAARWSVWALAAFAASGFALRLAPAPDAAPWPWSVTAIIGFTLLVGIVATVHGWRLGTAAYVVPAVAVSLPAVLDDAPQTLASAIVALSLGAGGLAVGALLHERVRVAGQLAREREVSAAEHERRLVAEERQRIARELHDVVAHGLSLIQVQATSARYRLPGLPQEAVSEFEDIARSARSSLVEMRHLLGALRGEDAAERAPQPSIEDIPALIGETERAGARVRLQLAVTEGVSRPTGIATYRIVQEAISNAVRHAPGAAIDVAVSSRDGAVLIEVANAPGDETPARSGEGHGLVGMRERAALLGGSLHAGPTAAGGFRVAAALPLAPQEAP
ncbi:sensor histidine kinase [Microbacterium sp. Marseille-Q6965]|uniref:sensor histidine kinase n=1 Tax=Microbacterium sp. Marseille-Q6965 TaxID=2965072 RepID=UPI0021B795DE|nr:histidine kinase [Microbacterium sp. Marseille-Q6965]